MSCEKKFETQKQSATVKSQHRFVDDQEKGFSKKYSRVHPKTVSGVQVEKRQRMG